ncbi:hypothetical protein FOZ62_008547, partial [Perkinsus olseni]
EGLLSPRRYQSSDRCGKHSSFLPLKKRSTRARERLCPSRQQRLQDQVCRLTVDCHKLRRYADILAERREGNSGQESVERRVQLVQRRLLREELRKLKEALEEHLAEGHRWVDKADMARSRVLELDARHADDSLAAGGVDAFNPSAVLVERYDDQVAAAVAAEERTLAAALACRELQDRISVLEDWLASNRRPPPSPYSGLRFDVDEELVKKLLKVRLEELEAVQAKLHGMDSGAKV